jgi:hypothetical protein
MIVFTRLLASFGEPFNNHKRLEKQGINSTASFANEAQATEKSSLTKLLKNSKKR